MTDRRETQHGTGAEAAESVTRSWPARLCAGRVALAARLLQGMVLVCTSAIANAAPIPETSSPDASVICESAATDASVVTGVPLSVLRAISLTETGRKANGDFRPWPWTVNMEGKGYWFDTRDEALAFVYKEYKRGARSFDVGCFQINFKWHGEAFTSIEQMFEPRPNGVYAARFLASLYAETGSWSAAAGAYHSRNPQFAEEYRKRFDRIHERVAGAATPRDNSPFATGQAPPPSPYGTDIPEIPDIVAAMSGSDAATDGNRIALADATPRVNAYPLLQAGTPAGLGSLVPVVEVASVSLVDLVAAGPTE